MTTAQRRKAHSDRMKKGWIKRRETMAAQKQKLEQMEKEGRGPAQFTRNPSSPFSKQRVAGLKLLRYLSAVRMTGDASLLKAEGFTTTELEFCRAYGIDPSELSKS